MSGSSCRIVLQRFLSLILRTSTQDFVDWVGCVLWRCVPMRLCTLKGWYPVGCVPSRVCSLKGWYSVGCLPRQVCTREGVNQGVFMRTKTRWHIVSQNSVAANCKSHIQTFYSRFCSSNVQSVKAFCPTLPETPGNYWSTDMHSCAECLTHWVRSASMISAGSWAVLWRRPNYWSD